MREHYLPILVRIRLINIFQSDWGKSESIFIQQMSESLLTYENYQEEYNAKCQEWRAQPVQERRCNDIVCVVIFFILFGAFLGLGGYYLSQAGSIDIKADTSISQHWITIVLGLLASMVLAFVYIMLVRIMPRVMVYALMGLSLLLLLGGAIVGFATGLLGIAIPCLIIFLVYSLVLFCLRSKIKLGIVLIQVAAQFLKERASVFLTPVLKVLISLVFTVLWLITLSSIMRVSDDKDIRGEDTTMESVVMVVWVFLYIFISLLLYYMMVFAIATACAYWYYNVQGSNPILTSYKWIFTSAFGSLTFGAILVAVVRIARLLINSGRRNTRNIPAAICLCIISCCLRNLENLLKILNHNAVIVMSVTGQNYINSAKTTIGILSRFLPLLSVADIITGLLVFWGIVIIAGITGFGAWLFTEAKGSDLTEVMIITILGSIMVSSLVLSVLVEAMSAVFIFYCFDVRFRELGYGGHNMPPEIIDALNGYVK